MKYKHIVILSGAGLSAESGLRTFRDNNGLWEEHRVEDVATPEAFHQDPDLVQRFYSERRVQLEAVEPGAAHRALAKLQLAFEGTVTLVTQNVDDLLTQAGATDVLHMHGELRKVRCLKCHTSHRWLKACSQETACPGCGAAPALRPDIVWFGEMPKHLETIYTALGSCDLFVSIGTSGHVYPAAGFVQTVAEAGYAERLELNLEQSQGSHMFTENRFGPAGELVPHWVDEVLKG
ncbi:NAD-dependent deacylase [Temperatibacter marinus]|uniref:NAD-dependent protein deacylase n=1 Tax=Temperatibacter marinus TaxID=1456591 RepID=A0AA52HB81_9PROT|nr:NAD-dependent deacylase [Temperatibacter marinus]WND03368.1 NAD-dependent deacylase [Temperatibacter marinus]